MTFESGLMAVKALLSQVLALLRGCVIWVLAIAAKTLYEVSHVC